MAYKALYRTYRPDSFVDMAGQKHIIKTLENAVHNNKIAHAYLFCGPRGTGKTSTAKIFAKAVNCENENKPCGYCSNCLAAADGTHPDIVEIDAASNNGVEEARNLIDKVKYAPIKGKYKIYIIDEVHMMSQGAYNALLKTIEEPPAHVIFILATTEPYKVLPTIISRCQRFDFSKVHKNDIIGRLDYICKQENINCEDEVLPVIAELADGGMRDALSILDQCYAYAPELIKVDDIFDIYGILTTSEKLEVFEFVKNKQTADLMNKLDTWDQRGIDIKRLTNDMVEILKEKVIYDYTKDSSMLSIMTADEMNQLSKDNSTKESLAMIDILMDSYEKYRYATTVISYLEIALLKMMEIVSRETFIETPTLRVEQPREKQPEVIIKPEVVVTSSLEEAIQEEEVTPQVKSISREESEIIEQPITNIEADPIIEIVPQETMPLEDEHINPKPQIEDHQPSEIITDHDESMIIMDPDTDAEIIETLEEVVEIQDSQIPKKEFKSLEDEYILRLLVSANKNEKEEDRMQMQNIGQYRLEIEYAKYANLLDSSDIIASGDKFIIVSTNSQAQANEINDLDKQKEFLPFINQLLKKKKKVFAISNIQYERVVEDFRNKHRINALPAPVVIEIEEEIVEKKDEKIETLTILFGQNIDIKED